MQINYFFFHTSDNFNCLLFAFNKVCACISFAKHASFAMRFSMLRSFRSREAFLERIKLGACASVKDCYRILQQKTSSSQMDIQPTHWQQRRRHRVETQQQNRLSLHSRRHLSHQTANEDHWSAPDHLVVHLAWTPLRHHCRRRRRRTTRNCRWNLWLRRRRG